MLPMLTALTVYEANTECLSFLKFFANFLRQKCYLKEVHLAL